MKQRLTSADRKRLANFLASPDRPTNTLEYHELQGFLYAVANAPEFLSPSDWSPAVFDGSDPGFKDEKELETITELLGALCLEVLDLSEHGRLPPDCQLHDEPEDNIGPEAPFGRWAHGFVLGQRWAAEFWNFDALAESEQEIILQLGEVLRVFADPEYLPKLFDETLPSIKEALGKPPPKKTHAQLRSVMASNYLSMLPEALIRYVELGRSLTPVPPVEVPPPKPKPNAPCPCGSGKKFKKCCGA